VKKFPVCLIGLNQKRCLVIGGGSVAWRKIAALSEAGAAVIVIAPQVLPEIRAGIEGGGIEWLQRDYRPGDLEGAFLVISATDDAGVNRSVWEEAEQRGCLVNVVDDPARSNFILPAVVRRGELSIAISTGGASPALARRLRESLEETYGPEYGELAEILAELRPELLARFEAGRPRLQAALDLIDSDLLQVIREHGTDAGRAYARSRWKELDGSEESPSSFA